MHVSAAKTTFPDENTPHTDHVIVCVRNTQVGEISVQPKTPTCDSARLLRTKQPINMKIQDKMPIGTMKYIP